MMPVKLLTTVVLLAVGWLLYGGPDLSRAGTLAVFAFTALHLLLVVFNRELFRTLGSDELTYGLTMLSMNIVGFGVTFVGGLGLLYMFGPRIDKVAEVPEELWGVMILGVLLSLVLPLLSVRGAQRLPDASAMRPFEPPRSR
jgi:hypothetical protein